MKAQTIRQKKKNLSLKDYLAPKYDKMHLLNMPGVKLLGLFASLKYDRIYDSGTTYMVPYGASIMPGPIEHWPTPFLPIIMFFLKLFIPTMYKNQFNMAPVFNTTK